MANVLNEEKKQRVLALAGDRDRQGWVQKNSHTGRTEQHFPACATGSPVVTVRLGFSFEISPGLNTGGERGIRTPDTRKGIHAFEARAFSHSAISPRR